MDKQLTMRQARPTDHGRIIEVMRPLGMVGFLVAFLSPARPEEGYAHFIGVDPAGHR